MSSTFHGIETARRSLFTQQTALNTTGHNIANANTEGFSRQKVSMAASLAIDRREIAFDEQLALEPSDLLHAAREPLRSLAEAEIVEDPRAKVRDEVAHGGHRLLEHLPELAELLPPGGVEAGVAGMSPIL